MGRREGGGTVCVRAGGRAEVLEILREAKEELVEILALGINKPGSPGEGCAVWIS